MSDKTEGVKKKRRLLGETNAEKAISISAIIVSLILIPILIFNSILILKTALNPDDVPSIGTKTPLIVLTESMEPKIKDGDLIIVNDCNASDVQVGDVIAFFDPASKTGSVVTHRVIGRITLGGKISFKTQGDNNDFDDRLPVPAENVIGIYEGTRIPVIGALLMFMQSTLGLILCVLIPLLAIVLYFTVVKMEKDKEKNEDIAKLKAEIEKLKASGEKTDE